MATLTGGPSATIPLEFQALWIARLLLDVLRGEAVWVRIEPRENIVRKAECIIRRSDGTTEAHQCKRQRGSKGVWSVPNLEAEGVITASNEYLRESMLHRFWFISGDSAPALRTLCERAAQFDMLHDFRAEAATSKETRSDFQSLQALLGLDPAKDSDLDQIRDFLRRFRPITEDVFRQRRNVEELASRWVEGEPQLVVNALEHLANTTVRRQLDANDLRAHLEGKGFKLRDLTKDTNLRMQLVDQCDRYARSFAPYLIGGQPLGREETADVVTALNDPSSKLVLVHGSGGSGKSGILYEVLSKMRCNGDPCLAIRLDQDDVGRRPIELARGLGLPAAPVACLTSVAGGRRAYLFIDQLDAIRWTSQHSPRALDVVVELIETALQEDIKIVVACRTFDAQDDVRIKTLFNRLDDEQKSLRRVDVTLSVDARDKLLERLKLSANTFSARQRDTLRSLQNIWLLSKLQAELGPTSFVCGADLNRRYWAWVRSQLSDTEQATLNDRVLPALIDCSPRTATDAMPMDLRSRYEGIVDRLLSIGALVRVGPKVIRFAHQTQFDFLAAERLSEKLRRGSELLAGWLMSHDELFHRNQLRQLLEMMRDDNLWLFLTQVKAIVLNAAIRFHLKHVALQVLGSTESPTDAELELLITFDADPTLSPHVRQIFYHSLAWFDILVTRGLATQWANAADEGTRACGIWLMRKFILERGAEIYGIVQTQQPDIRQRTLLVKSFASSSNARVDRRHVGGTSLANACWKPRPFRRSRRGLSRCSRCSIR
jgi:hypothetical protein